MTAAPEFPGTVRDLEVHYLFDPLMGDGHAVFSFAISGEEGQELVEGLEFLDPATDATGRAFLENGMTLEGQIEIDDAVVARYRDDVMLRDGTVRTNRARTLFVWSGSI